MALPVDPESKLALTPPHAGRHQSLFQDAAPFAFASKVLP
jgi:hypothetical protein